MKFIFLNIVLFLSGFLFSQKHSFKHCEVSLGSGIYEEWETSCHIKEADSILCVSCIDYKVLQLISPGSKTDLSVFRLYKQDSYTLMKENVFGGFTKSCVYKEVGRPFKLIISTNNFGTYYIFELNPQATLILSNKQITKRKKR